MTIQEERAQRTKWFLEARFGMFIHWGLYAIPARGEWVRSTSSISVEDYEKYFEEFDPINYDPKVWARAAKEAGMKYAVMTAKHHDGFCLFDSKLTDYKATNTKAGRDLIREYVDAFRAEGIRVGLYYSLIDWHHDDYPAFGDQIHPMRANEAFKDKKHDFDRYLEYMHGQVRELCTNYGQIDIMWFDFSYGPMTGEKWRATELINMVRSLQPGIIIDNRLEASGENAGSINTANPSVYSGDFVSPEQIIPLSPVRDEQGNLLPWECCTTINNSWGYTYSDKEFKSAKSIIRMLVQCVSKGGNLLLNVGPTAKGEIQDEYLDTLREVGKWMHANSKSIYNCGLSDYAKPEWGYYTQNGKYLYAHLLEQSLGPINLPGLAGKIKKVRKLADGSEMRIVTTWNTAMYPDEAFISFGWPTHATFNLPDQTDTVIELELKD